MPMAEIVEQAKEFVKKGYKEIMLLAQNVNSYKQLEIENVVGRKKMK